MNKLKAIFEQMILISFGILVVMTLEGIAYHLKGEDAYFTWYHLLSILVAAFLCSIPGLIFIDMDKMSRKNIVVRMVLHCILVYGITMAMGYVFRWYDSLFGYGIITVSYLVIYHFVWFAASRLGRREARQINTALDSIRDEE